MIEPNHWRAFYKGYCFCNLFRAFHSVAKDNFFLLKFIKAEEAGNFKSSALTVSQNSVTHLSIQSKGIPFKIQSGGFHIPGWTHHFHPYSPSLTKSLYFYLYYPKYPLPLLLLHVAPNISLTHPLNQSQRASPDHLTAFFHRQELKMRVAIT